MSSIGVTRASWCPLAEQPFQLASFDSIEQVDPQQWDRLTDGRGVYLSRAYLRAMEAGRGSRYDARYVMFFDQGAPVGARVYNRETASAPTRAADRREADVGRHTVKFFLHRHTHVRERSAPALTPRAA